MASVHPLVGVTVMSGMVAVPSGVALDVPGGAVGAPHPTKSKETNARAQRLWHRLFPSSPTVLLPRKGNADRLAPCTTTHTHPQGEPTDKCCEEEQSTESPFRANRRYMQDDPQMRASDDDDERGDDDGCPIDLLRVRNTVAPTLGGSLCDNKNHLRGSKADEEGDCQYC